jgi:hypothetical protein
MYRDNDQREFARALRNQPTDAERRLWHLLRAGQLHARSFVGRQQLGPTSLILFASRTNLLSSLMGCNIWSGEPLGTMRGAVTGSPRAGFVSFAFGIKSWMRTFARLWMRLGG